MVDVGQKFLQILANLPEYRAHLLDGASNSLFASDDAITHLV